MAKVSITEAAKLAGVSRSTLYRSYIEKGLLSISKDHQNKKCVDTSELLRVFGSLKGATVRDNESDTMEQPDTTERDIVGQPENPSGTDQSALEIELKLTKEQLEESREREAWYKQQISNLTDTMKLLEGPKQPQYPRLWWQFWK